MPRRPDRSPRPIVAQTESAPTPALRSQTGPDRELVDFEANALYIELWHERHTSFDRVVTVGGPTDRGARRADSPHQVYWKNGSIVKVVTSNGSEYLFDDDLDAEWLDYIVGDNGDLLEPHLRFEDWLRLVKSPAPEEKYLKVVDPECPIGAPIMHMPVSGIDDIEGVDDVLAGRVEQGVRPGETQPEGEMEQDEEKGPRAKRPRPDGPTLPLLPEPPSDSLSFCSEAPPSYASTVLEYSTPEDF